MKNLENLKLEELDLYSVQTINGGVIDPYLMYYTIIAAVYVEEAVDDFVKGVKKGYDAATN